MMGVMLVTLVGRKEILRAHKTRRIKLSDLQQGQTSIIYMIGPIDRTSMLRVRESRKVGKK